MKEKVRCNSIEGPSVVPLITDICICLLFMQKQFLSKSFIFYLLLSKVYFMKFYVPILHCIFFF